MAACHDLSRGDAPQRLYVATAWSWLAVVGLLHVALWIGSLETQPPSEALLDGNTFVALVLLFWSCYWLRLAIENTARSWGLYRCHNDHDYLEQMAADLDSPKRWKRRRALQTLADYCGHPFGLVQCWPLRFYGARQLEAMRALYKEWWNATEDAISAKALARVVRQVRPTLCDALGDRMRAQQVLAAEPEPEPMPTLKPMPPMHLGRFVQAMDGKVKRTLRRVARTINDIPAGQINAAYLGILHDRFMELCREALEVGLQLRCNTGAERDAPAPEPPKPARQQPEEERAPGKVDALLLRMGDVVKDAILDWILPGAESEEPNGTPLPPVEPGKLVTALHGKVEETLARLAEAMNEAPTAQAVVGSEERVAELLADLVRDALEAGLRLRVDAAVAGLPPSSPGGWVDKYRRMKAAEGELPTLVGQSRPGARA